ncbi:MAG: oligosaccharide flippase family protein [Solirubrobacteraceae bacterium]
MNPTSTRDDASADGPREQFALDQAEVDLVGSEAAGPAALRGSVLLGCGYVATIALSLVSAPLLIRHLGISDFGRYTTVVALVTVVNGLTDAGLMNVALREWASRTGEDRARFMRSLLGIRLELSAVGVVIGVLFAAVAGYDSTLVLGTLVAGVGMVFTAVTNLLTASLQGELRFGWVTVINLVRQVVAVALLVALVLAGAGLLPLLASASVAGVVALALAAVLVRGRMPLQPRITDTQWWPLVRDTLPYAAAIALNTFYFRITIVVMSLIATAQQTGYFATSFRVTEVLIGVPALAIGAAFPILSRAAHHDRDRFAYATERIVDLSVIAGVGLALVVALSAPWIVRVLAGPSGAPAGPVLQIQAIALAATFLTMACGFVFLSLRRHTLLLVANVAALLGNVILTLVLVQTDQAQGAAVAAAVAESCLSIGLLIALLRAKVSRIRVPALLVVVAAGLVSAAPLLISGVHPLIRAVAGALIYIALLAACKRIPPEIRHVFQRGQTEPAATG